MPHLLIRRYGISAFDLFSEWSERADRLSDDPLEPVLIFIRLFEEFLDGLGAPFPGCVFASYTYESRNFGPEVLQFIRDSLEGWMHLYEAKLNALIAARLPRPSPRVS